MKRVINATLLLGLASTVFGAEKTLDTNQIEQITGLKGKMNPQEGFFKVSLPRTDVKVSVDRWEMPRSWA